MLNEDQAIAHLKQLGDETEATPAEIASFQQISKLVEAFFWMSSSERVEILDRLEKYKEAE